MEGHARKCVERYCELANKKTEQLYKVSRPCLDDHQIKKEVMEKKGWIVRSCSHTVLKCLYLARIGRLDILWVSQQTGTICHKMDSSMWQTTGTINFLHSFHERLRPMLSCGQCALSIGVISRFRLYRRSWRLKINIRRSFVHFWKSSICTDELDVQEANVSVSQLYRIRDHVVGCWFAYGRFMGFGHWSDGNDPQNTKTNPSMHTGNWCWDKNHTQD